MAKKNPSFLKRQKEHARKEKATEKRAARAERKKTKGEGGSEGEGDFLRDENGNLLLDEQGQPVRAPYAEDYYDMDDDNDE